MIGASIIVLMQGLVNGDNFLSLFLNGLLDLDFGIKRAELAETRVECLPGALGQFHMAFLMAFEVVQQR